MGIFEVIVIVNLDEERALNWFNDSWINKIGKPEYKLELDLKTNGLFYNAMVVKGSYEAFKELIDILWHSRIEGELVKKLQKVFETVYSFEGGIPSFEKVLNEYGAKIIF